MCVLHTLIPQAQDISGACVMARGISCVMSSTWCRPVNHNKGCDTQRGVVLAVVLCVLVLQEMYVVM